MFFQWFRREALHLITQTKVDSIVRAVQGEVEIGRIGLTKTADDA